MTTEKPQTPPIPPTEVTGPEPKKVDLKAMIDEKLNDHGVVTNMVVNQLVNEEQIARRDAIIAVVKKLQSAQTEAKKASEPDQKTFNADRTPATATFTKAALDKKVAADELVKKLQNALNSALSGDPQGIAKVKELAKGGGQAAT